MNIIADNRKKCIMIATTFALKQNTEIIKIDNVVATELDPFTVVIHI